MRLVHAEYQIDLILQENEVAILVIESPVIFSKVLEELYRQSNGEKGEFVLSEREQLKNFAKDTIFVTNPFSLNYDDKKIVQRLYQELAEITRQNMYLQISESNAAIINYLEQLILQVPYPICFDTDENLIGLFKLYNVSIDCEISNAGLLERLVAYMKIVNQLCQINVMIFLNLKSYLSENELISLYEMAAYEKMYLFLIENKQTGRLEKEKIFILDKDLCIINLE